MTFSILKRCIPMLDWLPGYRGHTLTRDGVAALVVTLLLIPQALAYALLAGMPPVTGLYASMLPLLAYGLFGTSRTLAIGPFAVVSIMTAAAVSQVVAQTGVGPVTAAVGLALLSGMMLVGMGLLRLGFLINFLSHPVISGFISATGILIAASQVGPMLGISVQGQTLSALVQNLWAHRFAFDALTLFIGVAALLFLLAVRGYLARGLRAVGLPAAPAALIARGGPALAVVIATVVSAVWRLDEQGVAVVGHIPAGLPIPTLPVLSRDLLGALWAPALLISIVTLAESISIAQTLASRRREQVKPDQELIGLGAANVASAVSGAFPVSGSLSRSAVNDQAGAMTPAAGVLTALAVAGVTLCLTSLLYYLPLVVLAAIIIQAVMSLVNMTSFLGTWRYSRHDGLAQVATFVLTLLAGVTTGLLIGVGLSLMLYVYRTSRPHSAVVGRVPGSEHFRNVRRHAVETDKHLAILRVDESLYFGNARFLEDTVADVVANQPDLRDLVLMCPAVNYIDLSALESLEMIHERLQTASIRLHLAEVKGPVMDKLKKTDFLRQLNGEVFLSTHDAWSKLRSGKRCQGA